MYDRYTTNTNHWRQFPIVMVIAEADTQKCEFSGLSVTAYGTTETPISWPKRNITGGGFGLEQVADLG